MRRQPPVSPREAVEEQLQVIAVLMAHREDGVQDRTAL
jgi:hypothetical protein